MTSPLPFTAAAVRRAIEGARSAGLEVASVTVHPDGAITTHPPGSEPVALAPPAPQDAARPPRVFRA